MKYTRQSTGARPSIWAPAYPGSTRFTTKRNEAMDRNAQYVEKMQGKMKMWDAEVDALSAEGAKLAEEARAGYEAKLAELRVTRDHANVALQELRVATVAASKNLYLGVELAWDTMSKALAKVSADSRK